MRIGLYGLPCAGKSFILDKIVGIEVVEGSKMLKKISPEFHSLSKDEKCEVRKELAKQLALKKDFIIDGHYSFGSDVVFTDEDGALFDVIAYLYVEPDIITQRMMNSDRNQKYLVNDIKQWQLFEIESLRTYCHTNDRDFYVVDNPVEGFWQNISVVLDFIDEIVNGFSCVNYAKDCANTILERYLSDDIILTDGDKTLALEDSSSLFGYKTNIFDGNFYTGFQTWRHIQELEKCESTLSAEEIVKDKIHIDNSIRKEVNKSGCILTSGNCEVWKLIAEKMDVPLFSGNEMSAETKYFITKFIQNAGKRVIAYGDSMNDYYMLKQADVGYLVSKPNGTLSRSLNGREVEGLVIVHH